MATHIQSPFEWGWDRLKARRAEIGSAKPEEYWPHVERRAVVPEVRRINLTDLREALRCGIDDFASNRTDIVFLCVIYPVLGLLLSRAAYGYDLVPLLFPLAAGFTLVGPFAAIGLNEISRRREQGAPANWLDAFGVLRSPSIGAISKLGGLLIGIFILWLAVAKAIYDGTLGPEPPISNAAFLHDAFTTGAGWAMIVVGIAVGFLFAALVLSISVISFPLLLDRPARVDTAIRTSFRAVRMNPGPMAAWGLVVAVGLLLGSIPLFLGLVVVMPVLGHATWHLYRRMVRR
jgi:uncharacterized membrane protein